MDCILGSGPHQLDVARSSAPTRFCAYSAIPTLVGLRQAGVPPDGYVAFITAAPVLDPVLFGALVLIVGPAAAILYAVIAFTGAMTLALIAQSSNIEAHLKSPAAEPAMSPLSPTPVASVPAGLGSGVAAAEGSGEPAESCGTQHLPWSDVRTETAAAAVAALGLLRSVLVLLLIGVAVGLVIEPAITPDDVALLTGNNDALAIPVAAALGTPLYFHTSLFIPIADALSNAGVGIGAIVALTISGAGVGGLLAQLMLG